MAFVCRLLLFVYGRVLKHCYEQTLKVWLRHTLHGSGYRRTWKLYKNAIIG